MATPNYQQLLTGRGLAATIPQELEENWKYLEPAVNIIKTMNINDREL